MRRRFLFGSIFHRQSYGLIFLAKNATKKKKNYVKLQRSIWLYQEVCDLGYIKTHVRGFLCIKTAYIIQFLAHAKNPDIWSVASITERELSEVIHLFEQLRTLESLCTYLTPFYSCFNSLSGPFRSYACRSCLLKNLFWLIVYFEKVPRAHRKCIIRFLPFSHLLKLLWNPSARCSYAMKRAPLPLFLQANVCFSCIKPSTLMKKWQQWVFINVMYYSTAFFLRKKQKTNVIFKERVLLFCLLCCTYILLEWSCRANKAAYFYFYFIFYTIHTCCSRTVSFIFAILTACPSE